MGWNEILVSPKTSGISRAVRETLEKIHVIVGSESVWKISVILVSSLAIWLSIVVNSKMNEFLRRNCKQPHNFPEPKIQSTTRAGSNYSEIKSNFKKTSSCNWYHLYIYICSTHVFVCVCACELATAQSLSYAKNVKSAIILAWKAAGDSIQDFLNILFIYFLTKEQCDWVCLRGEFNI